jgi:hypothetical protein
VHKDSVITLLTADALRRRRSQAEKPIVMAMRRLHASEQ